MLAVNADLEAKRAGFDGFRHGQDHRAQICARAVALSVVQSSPRDRKIWYSAAAGVKISAGTASGISRKFKAAALQRAQQVLGIHLIHNRTQIC